MQVTRGELEQLIEIQKTDLALLKAQKSLRSLPQREKANALSEKKAALEAKMTQVKELQSNLNIELKKLENEDVRLAEKEKHAQQLIEEAGSDYRSIETHTKELSGFAKRRETLSEKVDKVAGDLDKVDALLGQLSDGINRVNAEMASVVASYQADASELKATIAKLDALRADQAAQISPELMRTYDDTARKTAGVAVGRLEGGRCSVCRAPIDGGHLIELRASAPLGTCPSCKRLLVVD